MKLHGKIVEVKLLTEHDKKSMFSLMEEFYDNTTFPVFIKDLNEKDYCILLSNINHAIKGFSTQKTISVKVGAKKAYGVFSGDTIIHRDYWGSLELYKIFARYFTNYGKRYKNFYWFLTSKGYKTYNILPVLFEKFYPNYKEKTPFYEQAIINSFGNTKYPDEYDEKSGVVLYKKTKDKLKTGIADITEKQLKDKNIVHFLKLNPGYSTGNDLVCLTQLTENNFRPTAKRLLLGI